MKIQVINTITTIKDKSIRAYLEEFYARFLFNLSFVLIIWNFRFPHVFRKLYAEDGATLLQGTYDSKIFLELLNPVGGFLQFIGRLGGRFIRVFPLNIAPIMAAMFTAICIAFLASLIFQYSEDMLKSNLHRFMTSIFFLFIPIANFNSTGTVCNLYMYFMAASGILLFSTVRENKYQFARNAVIIIAALSNPLCIFLMPLIIGRILLLQKGEIQSRINSGDFSLLAGLVIQFSFILFSGESDRPPHAPNSIFSVIYLYLDRGIGSAIIPNWGFVSGNASDPQFENTLLMNNLYLRLFLSGLTLVAIVLMSIMSMKRKKNKYCIETLVLLLTSFIFTFIIGTFYSVEPRYMIFSSTMSFYALIILLDEFRNRVTIVLTSIWFTLLISMSLTPSEFVSQGPNWSTNLERELNACLSETSKEFMEIRIMPLNDWWSIKVPCPQK